VRDALERIRDAGRALGDVRELDVLDELMAGLEPRARFASETLADVRRQVQRAQQTARRRMVKTLDRLELPRLLESRPFRRAITHLTVTPSHLRRHIGRRAESARRKLERASGVYLPNRSHEARVAVKKLRYAAEVADDMGFWLPSDLLKHLRRAQSLLGDLHDRQQLMEHLTSFSAPDERRLQECEWLADLVRAEMETTHGAFLRRVPALESDVAACERWNVGSVRWNRRMALAFRLVGASAVLVPPLLRALDARRDHRHDRHDLTSRGSPLDASRHG
jgi:CHAD domain-containing protein